MVFSSSADSVTARVAWMFSLRKVMRVKPLGLLMSAKPASQDGLFLDSPGISLTRQGLKISEEELSWE